jgi:hypothetical protein
MPRNKDARSISTKTTTAETVLPAGTGPACEGRGPDGPGNPPHAAAARAGAGAAALDAAPRLAFLAAHALAVAERFPSRVVLTCVPTGT